MQNMTAEETRRFLLDTPRTGKLSTVQADGRPHVVPIWFDFDGETLVFTTWHTSVKTRNLRRDPRLCLCADDEQPPYAYVILEGTGQVITPTPDELLDWATRIARRYMGDALAETFGKRNGKTGELIVRATITNIIAHKGITD